MPILIAAGGFVSLLIDRFRWLAYLGAAVIAFTGGRMVLESAPVAATLGLGASTVLMISLALGVVLPASYRLLHLERREDAAER
jgi:predicted tellurium resistance membrane protein TerC